MFYWAGYITLYNTLILSSGFSGKTRFAKHSYQTVAFGVQPLGNSLYLHVYGWRSALFLTKIRKFSSSNGDFIF